jgi:ketosteroid isomerase-like protein
VMPSANLDLVRSIYAAWEQGDCSSAEWAHPEIEFVIADGPDPDSWTGPAGMAMAFRDRLSVLVDFRAEADEYRELGGGRVLVRLHAAGGRGKTSGHELVRFGAMGANLFHIHAGKVTRLVVYLDGERAFADLGLAPEGG